MLGLLEEGLCLLCNSGRCAGFGLLSGFLLIGSILVLFKIFSSLDRCYYKQYLVIRHTHKLSEYVQEFNEVVRRTPFFQIMAIRLQQEIVAPETSRLVYVLERRVGWCN